MEQAEVQVFVRGATGSPEDWAKVTQAGPSELPSLTEAERERASRFKWDQKDYARSKLLRQLADQKWVEKGRELASRVHEIMRPMESEYHLEAVFAEVPKLRWTVRFATKKGLCDIHLESDLVEDILNFNAIEDDERLRKKLLTGLGEERYLVPR